MENDTEMSDENAEIIKAVFTNNEVVYKNKVVIEYEVLGKKYLKTLLIPSLWEKSPFCLAYLDYFRSVPFRNLGDDSRNAEVSEALKVFDFIQNHSQYSAGDISQAISTDYMRYCNNTSDVVSNSIQTRVKFLVKPIRFAIKQKLLNKAIVWDVRFHDIIARTPKFNRNPQKKKPTLGLLFKKSPYTDKKLITSFRTVSCWLIFEMTRQRQLLLKSPNVNKWLNTLREENINEVPLARHSYRKTALNMSESRIELSRKAYGALVSEILSLKDKLLIERIYCSNKLPEDNVFSFTKIASPEEQINWVNHWVADDQRLKTQFRIKGKDYNISSIESLAYRDLLRPCEVETMAMSFLMGSERIQNSGQKKNKLTDFIITDKQVQLSYSKKRSHSKKRFKNDDFETLAYSRNSILYDVYKHWHDFMQNSQSFVSSERQGYTLAPHSITTYSGVIATNTESLAVISQLTIEGSQYNQKLIEDLGADASPFLFILRNVLEQSVKRKKEQADLDKKLKEHKKNGTTDKPVRSKICKTPQISLAPDYIAGSREASDSKKVVVEKESNKSEPGKHSADKEVNAALNGHSSETKINTYENRSLSPDRIISQRKFAVQVGERMEVDANRIKNMLFKTKIFDFEEAKKTLGLKKEIESFEDFAEEFELGVLGELDHDGKTVIVTTPLTSALIQGYIKHVDKELPRLHNDNSNKAKEALIFQTYLIEVLDSFPAYMRKEGTKLLEQYDIPYPSLI
jgi:hypothetical protein